MTRLFELLHAEPCAPLPAASAAEFLALHRARHGALTDPFQRAVAAGLSADRLGFAFAGGYQAALAALAPGAVGVASDGSASAAAVACLALTEAGGNTPRAIGTTLVEDGAATGAGAPALVLTGEKTFVTLGSLSGVLLVLARRGDAPHPAASGAEAGEGAARRERVALVLVRVPADTPGVTVVDRDPLPMVPEIGHGIARFAGARLTPEAVLPGDGWERYGRPFRTLEDVHVQGAALGYLTALGRRHGFGAAWAGMLGARVAALASLAAAPADAPATHLALSGALADGEALHATLEPLLPRVSADERARWERDRPLLQVAGGSRAARARRAAERLRLE